MVFLFDEKIVVSLIDNGDVELLGTDKIWLGEREVVSSLKNFDDSTVIQSRCKSSEEVGKETGLKTSARDPERAINETNLVCEVE